MNYPQDIADAWKDHFQEHNVKYQFDEQNGVFLIGMQLSDCKFPTATVLIVLREQFYTVLTVLPLVCEEAKRKEMADLLNRINSIMAIGNFEMTMDQGQIRYRYAVDTAEFIPGDETMTHSIAFGISQIKMWADPITAILFGLTDAEKAFAMKAPQNSKQ